MKRASSSEMDQLRADCGLLEKKARILESEVETIKTELATRIEKHNKYHGLHWQQRRSLSHFEKVEKLSRAIEVPWELFAYYAAKDTAIWKLLAGRLSGRDLCLSRGNCRYNASLDRMFAYDPILVDCIKFTAYDTQIYLCSHCRGSFAIEDTIRAAAPARSFVLLDPDDFEPQHAAELKKAAAETPTHHLERPILEDPKVTLEFFDEAQEALIPSTSHAPALPPS